MGYTTDFSGSFFLNKPLSPKIREFLEKLATTRRVARNLPEELYGIDGEFFVDGKGSFGQDNTPDVIDGNRPPKTQPGLWCQWVPSDDGKEIRWDDNEKFYEYTEWIIYIIDKILAPNGYVLNGNVDWSGEDMYDIGYIEIVNNKVTVHEGEFAP